MSLSSLVIQTAADGSTHTHTPGWIGLAYFFILCMGAVAKIASTAAKLSLHKDWVPVMAASNTDRLTNLNSSMRRIDLTANILSPLLVGLVSWGSSPATAVAVVGVWAAVSLFVELRLVGRVYDRTAALQFKAGVKEAEAARRAEAEAAVRGQVSLVSQIGSAPATIVQRVRDFSSHFLVNMRAYRSHPVFRASLAYAMLYISLLSLGGIMTSWLKLRGVSDAVLAGVRGIAAGVGIAATFASPWMIHRWGVLQAGLVAIWLQAFLLLPVGFAFVYYFKSVTTQLVIILTFLCLSRFGLWSFDLCQTQLMQRSVDPKDAGSINGAQESLCNISYTCSFILTMIFSNPDWFAAPVCISLLSVIAAAGVYTSYTADALHTDNPFPKLETFKLHKHVHSDDALAHPEWAGDAPAAAAAAGQDGEGQGEGQEGYDHAPPGGFPHSPTAEDFAASGDQFHGGAHGQHQYAEPEYEHNQFGYEYDDPHSAINYRYESTSTNN
jgi:iron-regulated transporter 1